MTRTAAQFAPVGPGNGPGQSRPGAARCRIPGCPAQVGRRRLMCRPHWYQVPKPLRDLIWATWRSGAGVLDPAYRRAIAQAVAAVQAATGRP
jgi:hypothetical protein